MEAQDQLERKYISKKEEHRALEMQNYMGLSRNTGTFDANRSERPRGGSCKCQYHVCAPIYVCVCVQTSGRRHIQDRHAS